MKYAIITYIIISVLFLVSIIWLSIEAINEINEIGLKEIFDQIWYGTKGKE